MTTDLRAQVHLIRRRLNSISFQRNNLKKLLKDVDSNWINLQRELTALETLILEKEGAVKRIPSTSRKSPSKNKIVSMKKVTKLFEDMSEADRKRIIEDLLKAQK